MPAWILTPRASSELEGILDYIAEDSGSKAIANKVAGDFIRAFEGLVASPNIGWRRAHLTGPGVRWWRVHSYLLVYDPESKPLRVIRVLHGARDLEQVFRPTN